MKNCLLKRCWCRLLVFAAPAVLASLASVASARLPDVQQPPHGVIINLNDYLPVAGQIPPCVNDNAQPGGERTFRFTCWTGKEHFALTKGDINPWGLEVFYAADGWLRAIEESGFDGTTQTMYRVFRDDGDHYKGWYMAPLFPIRSGSGWGIPPYHEEYWKNAQNQPSCWANHVDGNPEGANSAAYVVHSVLTAFLFDARSTPRWVGAKDVDAYELHWFQSGWEEVHVFGRYWDDALATWVPLGQVSFWAITPQHVYENPPPTMKYLVDCNPAVTCSACTDEP